MVIKVLTLWDILPPPCAAGQCDLPGQRRGSPAIAQFCPFGNGAQPLLQPLEKCRGLENSGIIQAAYGSAIETSKGKDTPSGHWEMAGVARVVRLALFFLKLPRFPPELTDYLDPGNGVPVFG